MTMTSTVCGAPNNVKYLAYYTMIGVTHTNRQYVFSTYHYMCRNENPSIHAKQKPILTHTHTPYAERNKTKGFKTTPVCGHDLCVLGRLHFTLRASERERGRVTNTRTSPTCTHVYYEKCLKTGPQHTHICRALASVRSGRISSACPNSTFLINPQPHACAWTRARACSAGLNSQNVCNVRAGKRVRN